MKTSGYLNEYLLPVYLTDVGRKVYDETLDVVTSKFPEYVDEIRGTADGAEVDFYKVFKLNLREREKASIFPISS